MLPIGIIWKKCWLIIVLFELGNCDLDPQERYNITKQNCTEKTIAGVKCMDCSSTLGGNRQMRVYTIPLDLGNTVRCLYMYNLLFNKGNNTMFAMYPDLTDLHMIRNGFGFDVGVDIFEMLTNLKYLNLSTTNIVEDTIFTFPKTIRILDLTALSITSLPIENLHLLEKLYVSRTKLADFPRLHELAPIKLIELHNVNMTNFKIVEFAKYCKLQSISTLGMSLGNDDCKCLQLLEWTKKFEIEVIHPPACRPDSKCSSEFTNEMLQNRDQCLAKSPNDTLYLYIAGAVLLLLAVLILSIYYHEKLVKEEEQEKTASGDKDKQKTKQVKEEEFLAEDEETLY